MTTFLLHMPAVAGSTDAAPDHVPCRRLALAAGLLLALPMFANAASVSYIGNTVASGQGVPLYIVLAPEGQTASGFLSSTEGSRWKAVANAEAAKVVVMDGGTAWDASADVSSLASLYSSSTSSGIEGASRYMAAYGSAGTTLAAYAAQYPNNIAGAAFIDATSSASLTGLTKPQRPLAVLTINSTGTGMDNFVAHVRTENARGGSEGSDTTSANDLRYYRTGSSAWNRDFTTSHFVRRMSNVASTTDMPNLVHANLFTKVSRWKTVQGNYTLRARVRAGSTGFYRITETVSGSSRDAYVYVPASVRSNPGVPAPVVMLFHGVTANGNYFLDQTEFNRVADEFGFIVYAPTAPGFSWGSSNFARYRTLITGFTANGITADGTQYAVDARRVYMHGFSNGSYFVSDFVASNGDVLAAAGSWAYTEASSVSGQAIPYWYGVGSLDGGDCPNTFVNAVRTKLGATSTSSISYAALDSANRVATTVYTNTTSKLEARCSVAASVEHGNLNEHSRNLWKDFFARYRRKADGTGVELIPPAGGNAAPVANFTTVTSGLSATFADTSSDSDGSIASRVWEFGDGTTSTMANPTKTYGAANTYSVRLTVTDNGGLTGSKTSAVTVSGGSNPACGGSVLCNGVAVTNLSGAQGTELRYTLQVPAGATNLRFATSGGSGDADLFIRFGSAPTSATGGFDQKSDGGTNSEAINVAIAQAGIYHVLVRGYSAFSGLGLTGSYTAGNGGGGAQTYANNVGQDLPALSTITSDIPVTGRSGNAPSNATLSVNISHTYRGDVVIDLIAPDGTVYPVKASSNDSADNVMQSYQLNLSSEPLNGTWRLRVSDVYQEDAGRLNSWSISF
ncbi:proprotein convertase P-domain-containing protein [Lysobacter brunescens]|uniref:Proprotein convertase P-domain-containing protein n=1 Tax=Lysobacter brunescens TaxID=262323 RepID=A0ABW2YDJ5_9GAMM